MGRAFLVVLMAVSGTTPALAQFNSHPVFVSPKGGTGLTIAADYGRGVNDDSGRNTAWGGRAILGLSMFSIGVGVATADPPSALSGNREAKMQFAAMGSMRMMGGPLVPISVNLHAGVGIFDARDEGAGTKTMQVPIGLGFGLNVPAALFSFEPWIAPRWSIVQSETAGVSVTESGLGLSAGINLGFANGLGVHAAVDWTKLDLPSLSAVAPGSVQPLVFGIGLQYTLSIPGL